MHGCYMLEEYSTLPAYAHSPQAFALLESFKFGEIDNLTSSIIC